MHDTYQSWSKRSNRKYSTLTYACFPYSMSCLCHTSMTSVCLSVCLTVCNIDGLWSHSARKVGNWHTTRYFKADLDHNILWYEVRENSLHFGGIRQLSCHAIWASCMHSWQVLCLQLDVTSVINTSTITDVCTLYVMYTGEFRNLTDVNFVCAMGPPGGGRNPITARIMRHFNYLAFTELEDNSKAKIFSTIVNWWLRKYFFLFFSGLMYQPC